MLPETMGGTVQWLRRASMVPADDGGVTFRVCGPDVAPSVWTVAVQAPPPLTAETPVAMQTTSLEGLRSYIVIWTSESVPLPGTWPRGTEHSMVAVAVVLVLFTPYWL